MTTPTSQPIQSFMVPGGSYGYTGAAVNSLTSFENTIANALLDESGSTQTFARHMELCVKEVVKSLRASPRADNLIYRQCHFATNYREHHGFLPLAQINLDTYDGCYQPGGQTHLYDAEDRIIKEVLDYGKQQAAQKYLCNAVIYVLTDGEDYTSTLRPRDVNATLAKAVADEDLESIMTFLIGVNPDDRIQTKLAAHAKEVGFTGYIPLDKADEKSLSKLANWLVSQSVAQSQALGTGGPSASLKF